MRGPNEDVTPLSRLPLVTFCCRICLCLVDYKLHFASGYSAWFATVTLPNTVAGCVPTKLLQVITWADVLATPLYSVHCFCSHLQQYLSCPYLVRLATIFDASKQSFFPEQLLVYWTPPAATLLEDGWSRSNICGSRFILSMGHGTHNSITRLVIHVQYLWFASHHKHGRTPYTTTKSFLLPCYATECEFDTQYLCKAGVLFSVAFFDLLKNFLQFIRVDIQYLSE